MLTRRSLIGAAPTLAAAPTIAQEVAAPPAPPPTGGPPPVEYVDPATGHRVVRLSPDEGGGVIYFHQNCGLAGGGEVVITSPGRILMVDVGARKTTTLLEDREARLLFTGRRTRSVYYSKPASDGARDYFVLDPDTRATRRIATLAQGSIGSINADETLLLGFVQLAPAPPSTAPGYPYARGRDGRQLTYAETREVNLNERLEARVPMEIFTVDVRTGERRVVHAATDWLNHIQFSPADSNMIMFCHEGPWHKVDRIWTIRTDGTDLRKIHTRSMNMEIAGHEFFAPDGAKIWYDLQTPRGEKFWLANLDLRTGKSAWYHLERDHWSVHFNVSPDGSMFVGDGGDEEMVAHAPDGKWLYLFHPEPIPDVADISAPNSEALIDPGRLRAERLVDMRGHDYRLEPNAHFTPDGKWIVFGGAMHGGRHVYAVEVAKA